MPKQVDFFAGLDSDLNDINDDLSALEAAETTGTRGDMRGQLPTALDAQRFALSGKAILTLVSRKTGARFTYRVSAAPDGTAHFVALLSGPDNESDYKYLGRISRGIFWPGRKTPREGDISPNAPSALAFSFFWRAVARGQLPDTLEVWHEGRCGRCGRKLTVPSSVALGFGPECADKV